MGCARTEIAPASDRYSILLQGEDGQAAWSGTPEFLTTPSSYSIQMVDSDKRCVLHLLNFTEPPGKGVYDVEKKEEVRTAMVCLLDSVEPVERLASVSGTLELVRVDADGLAGRFDMRLAGPVSGLTYEVSGEVDARRTPSRLKFQ